MKKLIVLIGLVLIICTSYFVKSHYYPKLNKSIWDFVPDNAVGVYDIASTAKKFQFLKGTGVGKGLLKLDLFDDINEVWSLLDTSKYSRQLELIDELDILISVHSVAKEGLDLIFFINISNENETLIRGYINDLIKKSNSILSQRVYNEREIFEIKGNLIQLSYFIEDGILIVSQTSFLVEDVIRTIGSSAEVSFRSAHAESFKANKLKNDHGDLYVNTKALNVFVKTFTSGHGIDNLGTSTFLDVKVSDHSLSLSGFTYSNSGDVLDRMKGQIPVNLSINGYVPNLASSVMHFGISDADSWFARKKQVIPFDSLKYWDVSRMIDWIGEELALVNLNTNGKAQGQLLLIDVRDVNDALNQLNWLTEMVARQSRDTVFYENYGDVLIKELPVSEFPEKVFGTLYKGFPVSYYSVIDNYLVFANELESMHVLINSLEHEDTWGRTSAKSQWLSNTLEEANFSYFFDYSQCDIVLRNALNETWMKEFLSNQQILKGIGMGAIQFSNIDGQFYTNIMLQYDIKRTVPTSLNFDTENTTYLESSALTKPFVVRNHMLPQFREIVIQDSLKNIYLIDHEGAISWQDSIGKAISSKVHQIDFYKNRKLQYLFAAGQLIYVLDRNGDEVGIFPLDVGFEIKQLSVLDYDHAKNYRILISDEKGSLYMYDKEGKILKGWEPKKMGNSLIASLKHIRVRGKDAIVAIQSNGEINVMNRKGEYFKGFPLKLENEVSGEVHINVGRDFEHTLFSTISNDGELLQFNLNGEIQAKKQFYKPTKDTFFELIEGVTENDFVITRQNAFRLSLLNAREEIIVEKDYLTSDLRSLQYYDLGGIDNIYVVNDFIQGFGYVYNYEGKLLNNVPINNEFEIGLLKDSNKNKTIIYSVFEDQVNKYSY